MSELIQGQSAEILTHKIKPKDRHKLNNLYWDAVDKMPMRDLIKAYPEPRYCFNSELNEIKLWLGRQHGEKIIREHESLGKFGKKEMISPRNMATNLLMSHFNISSELATKYLALNEQGFFDEEKKDSITQHWKRRANIDLRNYKELLEGA